MRSTSHGMRWPACSTLHSGRPRPVRSTCRRSRRRPRHSPGRCKPRSADSNARGTHAPLRSTHPACRCALRGSRHCRTGSPLGSTPHRCTAHPHHNTGSHRQMPVDSRSPRGSAFPQCSSFLRTRSAPDSTDHLRRLSGQGNTCRCRHGSRCSSCQPNSADRDCSIGRHTSGYRGNMRQHGRTIRSCSTLPHRRRYRGSTIH